MSDVAEDGDGGVGEPVSTTSTTHTSEMVLSVINTSTDPQVDFSPSSTSPPSSRPTSSSTLQPAITDAHPSPITDDPTLPPTSDSSLPSAPPTEEQPSPPPPSLDAEPSLTSPSSSSPPPSSTQPPLPLPPSTVNPSSSTSSTSELAALLPSASTPEKPTAEVITQPTPSLLLPRLPSPYAADPLADPILSARPTSALPSSMLADTTEAGKFFPPNFCYSPSHPLLSRPLRPFQLPPSHLTLHQSFSYNAQQRYNLHYIDANTLLFIAGNTTHLFDPHTGKKTVLTGHSPTAQGGVASVAVHPSRQLFAVAEKGHHPSIFIHSYPALAVVRVLHGGTESAYSHVEWNARGDKLAAVGSAPDYLLSVWDWAQERVILRTKAFSQDVFRVSFSPSNDGRLISSGVGHIRFWSMAKTFTGLKLQGAIGKFGGVELSDVTAFVELPDGRVLSGSEGGLMLMWDAHLIQYQVQRGDGRPCHVGPIQSIELKGSTIVTAGDDGYLRMWSYNQLEFAEVSEDDPYIRLEPLQEVSLGKDVRCLHLVDGAEDEWLIQDANGAIHTYHAITQSCRQLISVHSGAIHAVVTSPHSHVAVTAGADRSLRCWDLYHGTSLYSRTFPSAITALHWAPLTLDPTQSTLYAGFADGTVRAIHRYLEAFITVASFKPHRTPVTHLSVAPSGRTLVTASASGELFFFSVEAGGKGEKATAIGCVKLGEATRSIGWDVTSSKLLMAVRDRVVEVDVPEVDDAQSGEQRDSYVLTTRRREWRADLRHRAGPDDPPPTEPAMGPPRRGGPLDGMDEGEEEERRLREKREERRRRRAERRKEEDECAYDVGTVVYAPHSTSTFYFTLSPAAGVGLGGYPVGKVEALYLASFDSPQPLRIIPLGPSFGPPTSLSLSPSLSYLLIGSACGCTQVRPTQDPLYFFSTHEHDRSATIHALAMSMDERMMVSVGGDGGMFVYVVDGLGALAMVDRGVEGVVRMEKERKVEERKERQRKRLEDEDRRRKERREMSAKGAVGGKADKQSAPPASAEPDTPDEGEEGDDDVSHLTTMIGAAPVVVTSSTPAATATGEVALLPTPHPDPLPTSIATAEVMDSLTATSYSIEEAKAKAEEDERARDLHRQQRRIEGEMAECRAQWQRWMRDREEWEGRVKAAHFPLLSASTDPAVVAAIDTASLPPALFDLDPTLPSSVASLTSAKVSTLHSSLAYSIERHQRQLAKLRAAFLDTVEAESFVVRGFDVGVGKGGGDGEEGEGEGEGVGMVEGEGVEVWSYRLVRMPRWLEEEVGEVQRRVEEEEEERQRAEEERQRRLEVEAKEAEQSLSPSPAYPSPSHAHPPHSPTSSHPHPPHTSSSSPLDSRYHQRLLRQRQIDHLLTLRPPTHQPTPTHLASLSHATSTIGDYKLKSASDYIVPPHRKVNVERVRRRMVSLLDAVQEMKRGFNRGLLEMREMKERIKAQVREDRERIVGIMAELRGGCGGGGRGGGGRG